MRILSIDGGGIRGIFAANLLRRIHAAFGVRFHEAFDLIVGTSSGSITAAALAIDYPLDQVVELFDDRAGRVFKRRWYGAFGLFAPRYDKASLAAELGKVFGERKMSDALTLLLVPATNLETGDIQLFESRHLHLERGIVKDSQHVRMADAVLASCAAPTFFSPHEVDGRLMVDGGLWANNPAMLGLLDTMLRSRPDLKDVRMLSIGAGSGYHPYAFKNRLPMSWGVLTGLGLVRPYELLFALQANSFTKFPAIVLNGEQFLRLNFEKHDKVRLDNTRTIPELKRMADEVFEHKRDAIGAFIATL
jgi:hypothetical protein